MITALLSTAVVLFLAYANGANDGCKGVATLFGSGTADYRRALAWGTLTTLAGSLCAITLSAGLVQTFSGAGLVPEPVAVQPGFLAAVAFAAAATVLLATRMSFPVSTTHALTGALLGAGIVLAPGQVNAAVLGERFLLPLLVSPALALTLTGLVHLPLRRWLETGSPPDCLCVGDLGGGLNVTAGGEAAMANGGSQVSVCHGPPPAGTASFSLPPLLDSAHYLSAGAVSFARGLNDTPKIVALLVAAHVAAPAGGMALVGIAIALGAILSARRVAETMAHRITPMTAGQGFLANLVTAGLVILASRSGWPVSTTHVSCGALFGLGATTGGARWKTIGTIVLAWVVTLPVAAVFAAAAAWVA